MERIAIESKSIPKFAGVRFQLLFNPNLAMVEVFSRDGIESKKKAATCHPTDDMQDCNFGRSEQFSTRQLDHSKHLPKRTSSYPALPTRFNQVLMGKSTSSLIMRGTNHPAITCVPLPPRLCSSFRSNWQLWEALMARQNRRDIFDPNEVGRKLVARRKRE